MINIYTDGSCLNNPGPGGWAAIIEIDGLLTELAGFDKNTTNNRMEILAVIEGLKSIQQQESVTVYTDSQYVVNTITKNWKKNANKDLWLRLDKEISQRNVSWQWIRGHNNHPQNEMADKLANKMAKSQGENTMEGFSNEFSHIDNNGKARMVDVGSKKITKREAIAKGYVKMNKNTLDLIQANGFNKGDVLGTAQIAAVMASKRTSELIPLCHQLPLDQIKVDFQINEENTSIDITSFVNVTARTGVEMEALVAVATAALTIYDMCKSADRSMTIENIRLISKKGGRSGDLLLG